MNGSATIVRVYVVDDSRVCRFALKKLLQIDASIQVVGESDSAEKALREIPRVAPNVVLTDVLMPNVDGLELTRRLMASYPLPVILISDLAQRAHRPDQRHRRLGQRPVRAVESVGGECQHRGCKGR